MSSQCSVCNLFGILDCNYSCYKQCGHLKEKPMKKVDLNKALEKLNEVSDELICKDGKKAIQGILYAMAGCEEPEDVKLFSSLEYTMKTDCAGYWSVNDENSDADLKCICAIENGILVLFESTIPTSCIKSDSKGRILVKEGTVLNE